MDWLGVALELDPVVAMAVASLLFLTRLLAPADLRKVPWEALLLLGGSVWRPSGAISASVRFSDRTRAAMRIQ